MERDENIAVRRTYTMSGLSSILLALDVVGFVVAFNISYRFAIALPLGWFSPSLWAVLVLQLMTFYVLNLYTIDGRSSRFAITTRTVFAVVIAGLLTAGFVYITEFRDTVRFFFRGVLPLGFVIFLAWAAVVRLLATIWVQKFAETVRWLVITDLEPGSSLYKDIARIDQTGEMVLLLNDPGKRERLPAVLAGRVAGDFADFDQVIRQGWSGVILALEGTLPGALLRKIMEMRLVGQKVYDLTDFYEQFLQKVPIRHLRDNWFALSHGFDLLHHDMELKIKRLLDVFFATMLFVIGLPVILVAVAAILLDRKGRSKGPVMYRQLRTGANGREFFIRKFRTMVNNAEAEGARWAEENDPRITRVGRILRKSRIDELPQLWNVIKGEMSFIGPRPERPDFNRDLEKEIPYYDYRHLVKPGITGWAQVMYPYGASKEDAFEKLQYDIYYIKNYTLLLDLFIVLKTFRVMLSRQGR